MKLPIKGLMKKLFRQPDSKLESIAKDVAREVLPVPDDVAELAIDAASEAVKALTKKKSRIKK